MHGIPVLRACFFFSPLCSVTENPIQHIYKHVVGARYVYRAPIEFDELWLDFELGLNCV